ncbi:hypothetical protein HAX54_003025, partial [Datura stramonium]|nr:hypothetical protein [Datura stramonium]
SRPREIEDNCWNHRIEKVTATAEDGNQKVGLSEISGIKSHYFLNMRDFFPRAESGSEK